MDNSNWVGEKRVCRICNIETNFYGCQVCDKCSEDACDKHMHVVANARSDFMFINYDAICTNCLIEELRNEASKYI